MAIITLQSIQSLLRPGLAAVFGDYMTYPDQWKEIFTSHVSNKAVEYEVEMRLLPVALFKADGGAVAYGDMAQQYTTSYFHQNFGIGFQITANTTTCTRMLGLALLSLVRTPCVKQKTYRVPQF